MIYLANELRNYLIEVDIVRHPKVAGSQPTCYVDPREGAPWGLDFKDGDVQRSDTSVTLLSDGGVTPDPMDLGVLDTSVIQFVIRSDSSLKANFVTRQLVEVLGEQQGYELGHMHVERSGVMSMPSMVRIDADDFEGHVWSMTVGFTVMTHRYLG